MTRRVLAISLVVAITLGWPAAARIPQTRPPVPFEHITTLRRALAAYSAGDDHAVEALLRTRDGIASTAALDVVFGRPTEWTREHAAFLAEMAVAAPLSNPGKLAAIRIGRQLALSRPMVPGQPSADDRVEILSHQLALGILQEHRLYPSQLDYLDIISTRFNTAAQAGARFETRFVLARAIAAGGLCCPITNDPVRVIVKGGDRKITPRVTFEAAAALFAFAATDAKLAPEALIRGAALQLNDGRYPEALALLDRVRGDHGDRLLAYAQALTRGRVLDRLSRPEDAAAAYAAAREAFPTAQIPAVGQAAALLRTGHTTDAVRVATEARRLGKDVADPWVDFLKADARFVKEWLAELRRLRQ
jgi:hypothetical protein